MQAQTKTIFAHRGELTDEERLDQAFEVIAEGLIKVAQKDGFRVLKDKARAVKLDAEQHRGLAERQRRARSARTYTDELGMGHIHVVLEPHRYGPISARAEADAARLATADKRAKKQAGEGDPLEPFERYLADAYAAMLSPARDGSDSGGKTTGRAKRPELVVLVSHGVATSCHRAKTERDRRAGKLRSPPRGGP